MFQRRCVENQPGPFAAAGPPPCIKSSAKSGSGSRLLGRCVLPAFRRRDPVTTNAADIVTLDTRWPDVTTRSSTATAIVESMSADFTSGYCETETDASAQQHRRYARSMTTINQVKVHKSQSVHNSSCLTTTDDVTSRSHCQRSTLTQPCYHDDDDDDSVQLGTLVNIHSSLQSSQSGCPSDDRQQNVSNSSRSANITCLLSL